MDELFLTILNMSLTGAFVIGAVILARLSLKKAPKMISYCLWAVVGFRLVCPISFESNVSFIPFESRPVQSSWVGKAYTYESYVNAPEDTIDELDVKYYDVSPETTAVEIGSYLWPIGAAAMMLYGILSYSRLKQRMGTAIRMEDNVYETDTIQSPFVLGIIKPKIYLPISLTGDERAYILLHEQTHIRRYDHIIKFAAYFILSLHWFNPLVWIAFLLMGVDMEMSCDEYVLKEMGGQRKHDYSRSLLSFATEGRIIGGSPLAFGEGGMKERVKNVLNFKKPSKLVIIIAVALVAVLSVGFALDKAEGNESYVFIPNITATETVDGTQATALQFGYSYSDGKTHVIADSIAPWQGEYQVENTLFIDGDMGQNRIALSAENPAFTGYVIYLPDGTVYDDGTRKVHDSLSLRMYRATDKSSFGVIAPFEPGEYIYAVTIGWEKWDMTVTYGFKVVMTGNGTAVEPEEEVEPEDEANQLIQRIEENLRMIMSSPLAFSNPQSYIDEHQKEYEELTLKYPDGVLEYFLSEFEAENSEGLRGHIMMRACKDILGLRNNIDDDSLSPSEWYSRLSILNETPLPDFNPENPEGEYGALVYSAITQFYSQPDRGFLVSAPTVYGTYEEEGKLKIIMTVFYERYRLFGKTLENTGGASIPGAAIFKKDESNGEWAFEEYLEVGSANLPDGAYFNDSIQKLCIMPVSGKEIAGLAKKMIQDYSNQSRHDLLRQNLQEHLFVHGQKGVSLQEPGGNMVELT